VTISLLDAKTTRPCCSTATTATMSGSGTPPALPTLSEDQVADIFISALPGGGKRITIGDYHVKAFVTRLGVIATLWNAAAKK
jgi:hypothetical protein